MISISHCDWYAATVLATADTLLSWLDDHLQDVERRELKRHRNGFTRAAEFVDSDEQVVVHVDWGGVNPHPHLTSTGRHAPALRRLLRDAPFVHRVTRVDSALDFHGPTVFDDLVALILDRRRHPTFRGTLPKINQMGDWIHSKARTLALGGRSSRVYVRLYEKGYEQRSRGVPDAPLDWVRLEIEYKPQRRLERYAAAMLDDIDEVWGASGWTRDLWAALHEGVLLDGLWRDVPEPSSLARATRAFLRQYSATLNALRQQKGDDEEFVRWLLEQLDRAQRERVRG